MISDYVKLKNGTAVFDHIIAAYKIRGKQLEQKRTSHDKSVTDLISCTNIPANAEICFIDDLYHPLMDKERVKYIRIKPYKYNLSFYEMASRYYDRVVLKHKHTTLNKQPINRDEFIKYIISFMKRYNYNVILKSEEKHTDDVTESKNLYTNLEIFFKLNKPMNTRRKMLRKNKTLKH